MELINGYEIILLASGNKEHTKNNFFSNQSYRYIKY